jgi:hypothetical protein
MKKVIKSRKMPLCGNQQIDLVFSQSAAEKKRKQTITNDAGGEK